jgi:phosphatidylglycerophosphate synthase
MADAIRDPIDRRPIAARSLKASKSVASWLARVGATPNAISVAGMACGIAAGVALAATSQWPDAPRVFGFAAACLIQLRLLANMFDGMVAVETGQASSLGELYNEVPDRISDAATLIGAGYAVGGSPELGYVAACVAILTAYIRSMGKSVGTPSEFCGPMAKQQRMATITVIAVYCALAPAGWQPMWGGPPSRGLMSIALVAIIVGGLWTFVRRLRRIAAYLRNRE